jgi:hypothetical protein
MSAISAVSAKNFMEKPSRLEISDAQALTYPTPKTTHLRLLAQKLMWSKADQSPASCA